MSRRLAGKAGWHRAEAPPRRAFAERDTRCLQSCQDEPPGMNRVALFAHFDAQNEIKPYVGFLLERLRSSCSRIVFVTTSRPTEIELGKVRPVVDEVLVNDNVGFDFGMWQHALEREKLAACDELVLTNSSSFGPIFPLGPIFERMTAGPSDFWGMTDSIEHRWHLQSYFLVLKRPAISSDAFRAFWESVLPYREKSQTIFSYELGLSQFLVEHGLRPAAFAPLEAWATPAIRKRMSRRRQWNPTLFYPSRLLEIGMPFVKVHLLRDNVGDVNLRPVRRRMGEAGYDERLIQFDAEPTARPKSYFRRLAELAFHLGAST